MVLATKYLILALTFIISAQQSGISQSQKTELLNQAAINVSKVIPAYIEEQNSLKVASSTPNFGSAQPTPQDTKIISDISNQAMIDAQAKQALKDKAKVATDLWNTTRQKIEDNNNAQVELRSQLKNTALTAGQIYQINDQIKALQDEYTNVLQPLYVSQGNDASQAQRDAQ